MALRRSNCREAKYLYFSARAMRILLPQMIMGTQRRATASARQPAEVNVSWNPKDAIHGAMA